MPFAFLNFFPVNEIIDQSVDKNKARNAVKQNLIEKPIFHFQEISNTQTRHQKIHGGSQKGQKSGLIGKNSTLQG